MGRISGTLSGNGSSGSGLRRGVCLREARQRRVEHQPSAAQKHHRLEGRGVSEAVRPAAYSGEVKHSFRAKWNTRSGHVEQSERQRRWPGFTS